jgi:hypothetical protein
MHLLFCLLLSWARLKMDCLKYLSSIALALVIAGFSLSFSPVYGVVCVGHKDPYQMLSNE